MQTTDVGHQLLGGFSDIHTKVNVVNHRKRMFNNATGKLVRLAQLYQLNGDILIFGMECFV
ncbi:hypothetical protein D3C86_2007120 [compost metagenome]